MRTVDLKLSCALGNSCVLSKSANLLIFSSEKMEVQNPHSCLASSFLEL